MYEDLNAISKDLSTRDVKVEFLENAELKNYTTIGVGGKAKVIYFPQNLNQIKQLIETLKQKGKKIYILAGGSNTVFADKLDPEIVVINLRNFCGYQIIKNKGLSEITTLPGTKLQDIVDLSLAHRLQGMIELTRIPGTVGGAVVGNAGAYGNEIEKAVKSVTILDLKTLKPVVLTNEECGFGYRESVFKKRPDWLILEIQLQLYNSNSPRIDEEKYYEINAKRDRLYPQELLTPGSTFKNILVSDLTNAQINKIDSDWIIHHKLPAGKLLEMVGACKIKYGDIRMKNGHANIMINEGNGTFSDVKELIMDLQNKVFAKFKIWLFPEIRLIDSNFNELDLTKPPT